MDAAPGIDSGPDADSGLEAGVDSGPKPDSGSDASTCTCNGLVSAYRFANTGSLGHDYFGKNTFTTVNGSPQQSTAIPPGMSGHSLQLDGSSSVCIESGFTFDTTSDHTLCWWSRPCAVQPDEPIRADCGYDTWTTTCGADYEWRINNCNCGTTVNLDVPSVYTANQWVQICQTYSRASLTRTS